MHIIPLPYDPLPVPDAGLGALCTEKGNLPLDTVEIHAAVTGLASTVEVAQGFRNPYDVPLEATYVFPLPDRAAVTGMRLEAADRVIDGVLRERGEAREAYDSAIAAGQRAAIAEEDRPDVFSMRVGNILPGERVTVRLTLNQPLPYEDGAATFRFPLVVAPRYIPGAPLDEASAGTGVATDTDAVPDASRISPPVLLPGFPNPVALALSVRIDPAGLPLGQVASSLHTVTDDGGVLRLQPGERLDRDFILRLGYGPAESLVLSPDSGADSASEGGTFTLTVLAEGDTKPKPRDVVLVIDRSGSMGGWKMVAARRAAARIIDTLTGADRFAVLSFDHVVDTVTGLPAGLSEATDRNRFRAVEHLAGLTARGGTEMLEPLRRGAGLLADSARDRVLVLVTDGQVGNEDQILSSVPLTGLRVHTVGIDRAVNAGFLGRLAAYGQGRFELVESEDRLDEAMEHIHHRIGSPLVTALSLHGAPHQGLEILPETVAPIRLGAIFPGVPLVVSGRYRGSGALTVGGNDGEWQRTLTGTVVQSKAATAIWARAHLRDLEDRYAVQPTRDLEQRIVEISLEHRVLCRFTAFVAVDSRVVTSGQTPHPVTQPVELPDGWQPQMQAIAPFMVAKSEASPFAPPPPPSAPAGLPSSAPRPAPMASAPLAGGPAVGGSAPMPAFLRGRSR
ncbi:MAG: VIT domain-containing protein, partial [Streptosporangiaceae bacterium]